jgi:hypothetical protein
MMPENFCKITKIKGKFPEKAMQSFEISMVSKKRPSF